MRNRWLILGTGILCATAAGCATTADPAEEAAKVWMRDGSPYGAEEALAQCQPSAMTRTDLHLCMQGDGYSLEAPPSS